jgi:NCS1 family nucleobase:cation symporter-1
VVIPSLQWLGNYSWFIGMGIGLVLYPVLMRRQQASLTH